MRRITEKCLHSIFVMSAVSLVWSGPAVAHTFSAAPVHTTYHGGHANSGGHTVLGGFFRALFGITYEPAVVVQPVAYAAPAYAMSYGSVEYDTVHSGSPMAIQTDEERYRIATGLALPPRHGLIVVPPITPKGDVTYIWSNSNG